MSGSDVDAGPAGHRRRRRAWTAILTGSRPTSSTVSPRTPDDGEAALDLLMIAKYFERIGDHATNIAEWVMFSVTGVHKTEAT